MNESVSYRIESDHFICAGHKLDARLYMPRKRPGRLPVIIMAHGFAAQMDFGLHPFADAFAKEGYAVFMFDYRGFGKSEGKNRQHVNPFLHLQDYRVALKHVLKKPELDSSRVVLWGSSFSGGHALSLASERSDIKAVIAQVPFLDGPAAMSTIPFGEQLIMAFRGMYDILKKAFFLKPHRMPIVGQPGTLACMNKPDSYEGYLSLLPVDQKNNWQNGCPARISLVLPFYRPLRKLQKVKAKCLLLNAERESLFPPKTILKAEKKLKHCEVVNLNCGHFDPYKGKYFEQSIHAQISFLKDNL